MTLPVPTLREIDDYFLNSDMDVEDYTYVEKLVLRAHEIVSEHRNEVAIREANPLVNELWINYQIALKLSQSTVDNNSTS